MNATRWAGVIDSSTTRKAMLTGSSRVTRPAGSVLLPPGQGVPAGAGLLDGILGLGQGAQQPVREIDQLTPLAQDRVQARIGLAVSWPGSDGHGAAGLPRSPLPSPVRQDTAPQCEAARRGLTLRRAVLSYC